MLRILILVIALLVDPAITAAADISSCGQLSGLSADRMRWAALRKSRAEPGQNADNCRSYGSNFFEAVTKRQAASFCKEGIDRQRILELLDSEIDAFNDLIAAQCSGPVG
jgi:hypothetical protein